MSEAKEKVERFLDAAIKGDTQVVEQLVHPDYIQHNPNIPTGRAAFVGLLPILTEHQTTVESIRMFQDGDYVVVHNFWDNALPFGAKEMVSFDILRLDEDGLIAEHWDAMMVNTPPNRSGRTLIDGETDVKDLDKTEENRAKIVELFDTLINGKPEEMGDALPKYFDPEYRQHNPDAGDGISGFASAVQSGELDFTFEKQHRVFAEGNFVLSVSEGIHRGNPAVFYDLIRLEDGKIVEHWDVIQDIPATSANDNTMFNF